jgi:hypothetical protein
VVFQFRPRLFGAADGVPGSLVGERVDIDRATAQTPKGINVDTPSAQRLAQSFASNFLS